MFTAFLLGTLFAFAYWPDPWKQLGAAILQQWRIHPVSIPLVSEGCACITYTSRAYISIESFSAQIKWCLRVGNVYPGFLPCHITHSFYSWALQKNINNLTKLFCCFFTTYTSYQFFFLPFSITALSLLLHLFDSLLRNYAGGLSDIKDIMKKKVHQ